MRRRLWRKLQNINDTEVSQGVADSTKVICPGGEVESNLYLCPSIDTCPSGKIKCQDGSCHDDIKQCPTDSCSNGMVICPDGTCASDSDSCSTRTQCPPNLPTKCPDSSCALSVKNCPKVVSCPPETPFKCGTSGECRRNAAECPVQSICPEEAPIKCNDGSCVKSPYHCEGAAKMKTAPEGYIICPDGSFATSFIMCPSTVSCGEGNYKCVDGQCIPSWATCNTVLSFSYDVVSVSSNLPYRCPDGSFRRAYKDCPTNRVCLADSPILCDDNNCRQSQTQCQVNSQCGFGLTKCPDGTCTQSICGSGITCSISAPYICYDNTCRKDPKDCPQKQCSSSSPILCIDGTCVGHRIYCVSPWEPCSPKTPVRCPDSQCYESASECKQFEGCPPPFVKCPSGECSISIDQCKPLECPTQVPYKCNSGKCVQSSQFCDVASNGCPYNKPVQCEDGSCTTEETMCKSLSIDACSTEKGFKVCPNGSCMSKGEECPNIYGCRGNLKMCASGECISPNKECNVAICPDGLVKCADGICALSNAYCKDISELDYNLCASEGGNNVPCADGTCVSSSDQCAPLFDCPANKVRCNDGTCNQASFCPMANTCPESIPVRCENGACALNAEFCINDYGCPKKSPYKCESGTRLGLCVENVNQCYVEVIKSSLSQLTKCSGMKSFLCLDGECAATQEECLDRGYGCNVFDPTTNSTKTYTCPDGSCKSGPNDCEHTSTGCPLDTPFKCADGSCKKYEIDFFGDSSGCTPKVVCPDYQPYLCQSGECVGDPTICKTVTSQVKYDKTCPESSPIMCSRGFCVNRVTDCLGQKQSCPKNKPYLCYFGTCSESPYECTKIDQQLAPAKSRLLQATNPDTEIGCTDENPAKCYDGSCQPSYSMCPIYPGCTHTENPYKCPDGSCKASVFACSDNVVCDAGTKLCVDGICRKNCENTPYNGCPSNRPLKCGDNTCAKTLSDCAGSSYCNENAPFRCSLGECVTDIALCKRTALSHLSEAFTVSVEAAGSKTLEFIVDNENLVKNGKLTIPSGALLSPLDSIAAEQTLGATSLRVTPVAYNDVSHLTNPLSEENQALARLIFPLTDGVLGSTSSIRSPIVRLVASGRKDSNEYYRFPLTLELKADAMNMDFFNPTEHMCLATVEEAKNEWECASRTVKSYDSETGKIAFTVPRDGVYTVIFNPKSYPTAEIDKCAQSLICNNRWYILAVLSFFCIVVVLGSYVFWRMYRYVLKYRESKKKMDNIIGQYNEVKNITTDTPFQSVGDKLEGIVFRRNPLLKMLNDTEENEEIKLLRAAVQKVDSDRKILHAERKELLEKHNFYSREIHRMRNALNKTSIGEMAYFDEKMTISKEFE